MTFPSLTTPRLLLRPWEPDDADRLFEIVQEQDIFRYFPSTNTPPRSWVDKYIAHHQTQWRTRGYGHWAVTTREEGTILGWTGLEYLLELEQTEVAYLLSKAVHGRGYATEAAQAAVAYGFQTCRLPRIIGLVHRENSASIRVLEKCGMTFTDCQTLWGMELLRYTAVNGSAPSPPPGA